jgi:hypothetical protein
VINCGVFRPPPPNVFVGEILILRRFSMKIGHGGNRNQAPVQVLDEWDW